MKLVDILGEKGRFGCFFTIVTFGRDRLIGQNLQNQNHAITFGRNRVFLSNYLHNRNDENIRLTKQQ